MASACAGTGLKILYSQCLACTLSQTANISKPWTVCASIVRVYVLQAMSYSGVGECRSLLAEPLLLPAKLLI